MNKIKNTAILLMLSLWATISISCDNGGKWSPGPQPGANNPGVYFDKTNPLLTEVDADKNGVLKKDYFILTLGRDDSKTESALDVPVTIRLTDSHLSIPQTVRFEAGSASAELKINIKSFEFSQIYRFSVEFDEAYCDPYNKYTEAEGGSTRFDGKVEVVCLLADATFTPTDYSGTTPPQFTPFKQKIYDNRNGSYTIKNFLYNRLGYSFTFNLDANHHIRPVSTCGYHSTSDFRWYFYSANSDATANYIPCYIPGANELDWVTYIYFYTPENSSTYTAFWINTDTKTGRMMGYSRYSVSSSGRIAFDIAWD